MKYILVATCLFAALTTYACKCPDQQELSLDLCRDFDYIAKVQINSVSTCNGQSIAYASVLELFKGISSQTVALRFDCSTSCQMNIEKGDTWLFYAKAGNNEHLNVSFCDRNRKFFMNDNEDFYREVNQMNFDAEIDFLKSNIGLKPITSDQKMTDITQRENESGSGEHKIGLVVASVVFFLLFYFLFNKYFK